MGESGARIIDPRRQIVDRADDRPRLGLRACPGCMHCIASACRSSQHGTGQAVMDRLSPCWRQAVLFAERFAKSPAWG